ncbi:MAG: hypothetical protein EPO08_12995 [Rhodospirillaceae bacterium]|nr:MAG: hypothetical protein EPO08_12995 [Rhodospirillaceae bacterium]
MNITTSDPGAVKATADALALGATSNADTLSHISSDNKNAVLAAFSTSSDLLNTAKLISDSQQDTLRRSTADAISAASQSATLAAQTASDITHSALTTVGNVTSDYFSAAGSLSDLVSKSGVNNQQFATGLVDSVLQASQSQDAKNYDATLSTLVKIGGIIAASFAAILIFGKARA